MQRVRLVYRCYSKFLRLSLGLIQMERSRKGGLENDFAPSIHILS